MQKENIFELGIGTWKINPEDFEKDLEALLYSYKNGQNYLGLYMMYNGGEVVRSMKRFIEQVDRTKLFISATLEPTIENVKDVEKQLDEYLNILDLEYVDLLQIHGKFISKIPLIEIYREIKRLVKKKKVKYIGISNVNLEELKEIDKEVKIDFFEGVYNLECKIYEDIRVLDYCNQHDIKFICYQPLRRNRTSNRNYEVLVNLSKKYEKTQNQILLNWLVKNKKILPLIKSTNIERIKENLEALNFEMSEEDYQILNNFRNKEFDKIEIDWDWDGGVTIDQLANQLD